MGYLRLMRISDQPSIVTDRETGNQYINEHSHNHPIASHGGKTIWQELPDGAFSAHIDMIRSVCMEMEAKRRAKKTNY